MQPISVEKFADMVMKNNKGYHKKELVKTLRETLAAAYGGGQRPRLRSSAAAVRPNGHPNLDN